MTYEDFVGHYHKYGRCPNDWAPRDKPLNDAQLKTRYRLYTYSEKESKNVPDPTWELLKEIVDYRDGDRCRLITLLSPGQLRTLKQNSGPLIHILDHAHVFSRSARPDLKYDAKNVIILNRYSHSMIDQGRDPVYGELIKPDVAADWWRLMIGEDLYEELKSSKKKPIRRIHV